MNEQTIEKLLRDAPAVRAPAGLLKQLQSDIELSDAGKVGGAKRDTHHALLRRWLPALGFALWFLGCMIVFGFQANQIAELKRAHQRAEIAATAALRVERDRLQRLLSEIDQLRKDAADVERLRAGAAQLRTQLKELEALREQNQQLRAELKSQVPPPPKPEEDFFFEMANRTARARCINNLKQVGLAARLWARDSKTDAMPTRWNDMLPYLDGSEAALKFVGCPGVAPYEVLSFGAPESDPSVVFIRCAAHNIVGLVDGSVQQLGDKATVIQRDGKWIFTRTKE